MESNQKPLAIVNTKAIYESDIDEVIEQMGQRGAAYNNPQGRAAVLEQLIAQRLFLADAMRNLYEREPAFKAELARIKEQLLTQYAISKAVDSVTVTDIEARKYSSCPSSQQGGSLGEFGRGQMVPEFDQACFDMETGEVRGPIKTRFGYHLIRLDGKGEGKPVSFNEAAEQIKQILLTEKRQKAYQSRVNQLKILYPVERP